MIRLEEETDIRLPATATRLTATIVIPSHNRVDDLALTCHKLTELDPAPEEVVIYLDACADNSLEMLRRDFPAFRVVNNETKAGSIANRDRAFREVKTDLIISLDDDSYPLQKDFLNRVSDAFGTHPEAGVITFVELRMNNEPPDPRKGLNSPGHYLSTFAGCGAAIRRSVYGEIAHYSTFFFHNYEEPDFCVQCYGAGYALWFEPSIQIRHHFTPNQRNLHRGHLLNARNELLSVIQWCPFPQLVPVAAWRIARQAALALTCGVSWVVREPLFWFDALRLMPVALRHRKPIPWKRYSAWMRLAGSPLYTVEELGERFNGNSAVTVLSHSGIF